MPAPCWSCSRPQKASPRPPPASRWISARSRFPELTARRERLLRTLVRTSSGRPATALRALGLSAGQAGELERNAALAEAPAAAAADVYTGVLYEHLRLGELPEAAHGRVLIASALWGMLRPGDRIPAYKLSITAQLPRVGGLAAYWRPALRKALPASGLVVDLRSGGYAAAWRPADAEIVDVRAFTELPDGRRAPISHMVKATRGTVARLLLEAPAPPEDAAGVAELVAAAGHDAELTRGARRLVARHHPARMSTADAGLIVSVFLAAAVEFVEALTIVLAMGVTRGWRSALPGWRPRWRCSRWSPCSRATRSRRGCPEALLQLIVGTLLLIFGLQWLRKAILRSAGLKALNDEDETYEEELAAGRAASGERHLGLDWFGFVVSFKGVFLEGLEIVFIVLTFGLNADNVPVAAAGAALAGLVVVTAGVVAHRPLARVPQNTIKFAVGLLLSTFGTFWAVEGLGVFAEGSASLDWPGGDLALVGVLAAWCAFAWAGVRLLRTA